MPVGAVTEPAMLLGQPERAEGKGSIVSEEMARRPFEEAIWVSPIHTHTRRWNHDPPRDLTIDQRKRIRRLWAGGREGKCTDNRPSETHEVFKVRLGDSGKRQYKCKTALARWLPSLSLRNTSLKSRLHDEKRSVERQRRER